MYIAWMMCIDEWYDLSNANSSFIDFFLDELVKPVPSDGFSSVTSNTVDDFHQLVISVSVFQLLVDVPQVIEVEFSFGVNIKKMEVSASSLFSEGATLSR